jgi:hypothetical protein
MKAEQENRFLDDGTRLVDFLGRYSVTCPVCGSEANVAIIDHDAAVLFASRRLTCVSCGLTKEWREKSLRYPSPDEAIDWYFRLPYYFQKQCAGHALWVANREHLNLLRAYVAAKHRTRKRDASGWRNKSAASRIPKWIADGTNRTAVLKALDTLEAKMKKTPNQSLQPTALLCRG